MPTPVMYPLAEVHEEYRAIQLDPEYAFGCSPLRSVPKFVTDFGAWEHCAERTFRKTGLRYDEWGPREFAAATAHYKNRAAKNEREKAAR